MGYVANGQPMNVDLSWYGPLRIPDLVDEIRNLPTDYRGPHLYFYVREYRISEITGKTVVYVGQATNFVDRLLQHLHGILGLQYWPRNASGEYVDGDEADSSIRRLDHLNQIDRFFPIAIAEVKRLRFFAASCPTELLKVVEAALIDHVKKQSDGCKLVCDNARQEWHGWDGPTCRITIRSHKPSPEAQKYLDLVFGRDEITWGRSGE